MNATFKTLFTDKIISISFWTSIFLLFVTLGIALVSYVNLPPFLPIYNKMAWGYARLGKTYEIFLPIILPTIFLICNIFFARFLYARLPLLARFLLLATLLIALFTFIFILKLVLIIL